MSQIGYTTDFTGQIAVVPPLNEKECEFLVKFSESRRMLRSKGPYFVDGEGYAGQDDGPDQVFDHNAPDPEQPGLWCQWIPTGDGTGIEWDGGEKFYDSPEWMNYLIKTFFAPGATVSDRSKVVGLSVRRQGRFGGGGVVVGLTDEEYDAYFGEFTFDHTFNGEIEAQGEDPDDRWKLVVKDNEVSTATGRIVYDG